MHRTLRYLLLLALATAGGATRAADAPWYQVEIVVFENLAPGQTGTEVWPDDPGLPDSSTRVDLIPWAKRDSATVELPVATGDAMAPAADAAPEQTGGAEPDSAESQAVSDAAGLRPFVVLPEKFLRMNDLTRKLEKSAQYRVLVHTGWRQPLTKAAKGQPVHISAGASDAPLDGNVTVSLSRYLHLQADLVLRKALATNAAPPAEAPSTTTPAATSETAALQSAAPPQPMIFRMTQSRRMRSTEIHYLDHPAMGVIAQITPVKLADTPQ